MPTREEILNTLAASQEQVLAFFQALSLEDLERPCMASGVPGEAACEQLAAPASVSFVADRSAGDLFAANAQHAAAHMTWIEEGFRQGLE